MIGSWHSLIASRCGGIASSACSCSTRRRTARRTSPRGSRASCRPSSSSSCATRWPRSPRRRPGSISQESGRLLPARRARGPRRARQTRGGRHGPAAVLDSRPRRAVTRSDPPTNRLADGQRNAGPAGTSPLGSRTRHPARLAPARSAPARLAPHAPHQHVSHGTWHRTLAPAPRHPGTSTPGPWHRHLAPARCTVHPEGGA